MPGLADVSLSAEVEDVRFVGSLAELRKEIVDRGRISQVCKVHLELRAQVNDVVQRTARGRTHERVHAGAEVDERFSQVRPHEPVRPGH
jgi:hypothetical protein